MAAVRVDLTAVRYGRSVFDYLVSCDAPFLIPFVFWANTDDLAGRIYE